MAPINTNATFTCIVNETFLSKVVQDPLEWEVSGVRTSHPAFTPFSNSRRIFVSALEHLAGSLLTVAASVENNGIRIECVVYVEGEHGGVEPVQSEMVYLTVYGMSVGNARQILGVLMGSKWGCYAGRQCTKKFGFLMVGLSIPPATASG